MKERRPGADSTSVSARTGFPSGRATIKKENLADLWPGQSVSLLKALHILTHNGGLNADSRRKLKQVQHLAQLIKPAIDASLVEKDLKGEEGPVLADLGAGKSYLGLILYDLYFGPAGRGRVLAVEARPELVASAKKIAAESGFTRMEFVEGKIAEAPKNQTMPGPVDIVTALHACDTATDEAILFALKHDAKYIALVPCCQAELARDLEGRKNDLDQLWRHPHHRREMGSHLTNVLRGLFLEAHGYKVRVTELTGLEHSLKNEFLFAERHQRANPKARAEFAKLAKKIGAAPKLLAMN